MDDKDWLILRTIDETRNLTRASERLFTSQPAISYRLRQLERRLDIRILDPGHKTLTFTPQGEYLIAYARRMLEEYRKAADDLSHMTAQMRGVIRIGVSSNYAAYRLPRLLEAFRTRYPGVEFSLTSGLSPDIFRMLQHDEIHLALTRDAYEWKERAFIVDEDPFYLLSREPLELAALPERPRIMLDTNANITQLLDAWWNQRFSQPAKVAMRVDKLEICLEMVRHGLGYAIVSGIALGEDDPLRRLPIEHADGERLTNKTWLLYRQHQERLPLVHAFIAALRAPSPATS